LRKRLAAFLGKALRDAGFFLRMAAPHTPRQAWRRGSAGLAICRHSGKCKKSHLTHKREKNLE
jgi:hypothetical protein